MCYENSKLVIDSNTIYHLLWVRESYIRRSEILKGKFDLDPLKGSNRGVAYA